MGQGGLLIVHAGPQAAFLATGARNGGVLEGTGPRKGVESRGPGLTREAQKGKEGQEPATGSTGRRASVTMGTGANLGTAVQSAEGHIPGRDVETPSQSGEGPTLEVQG